MRSVDVMDGICFAGLDVHARKTAAAAVALGSGEVWKAQLAGTPHAAIEWLQTLPGEVRAVYEAGGEDLRGELMSARHRISKLLLRYGHAFEEPGETWSTRH
jgi:hypothetical protein